MWVSFIIWVYVILLNNIYTSASEVVSQPDPVMIVSVGDNVTLHCFILKSHSDSIVWYKQTSGQQLNNLAIIHPVMQKPLFYDKFVSQRFSIEKDQDAYHLKISNVTASDEAMYYCGLKEFAIFFGDGTYLTLKGSQHNQHKSSVSVLQQPVSASVHPGDTVTLLCSVLSEHTTADIRMFWFRSDSDKSVSQIIYTRNQSEIDSATQSCTYNLSKDIINQKDTGMYYCAVIICGKILFGNGTNINIVKPEESIVIILGVLLGVCVFVITAQAVSNHKKERYCNKRENVQNIDKEHLSSQDCDGVDLHYAAPHFKEGNNRRLRRTEAPQDSVYSQLNNLSVIEYRVTEETM